MSTDKTLDEISVKLDKILKLLAVDVVKTLGTDSAKIELLDSLGFRPVEIANFLNKNTPNVTAQLSYLKKKKDDKKKITSEQENNQTRNSEVKET